MVSARKEKGISQRKLSELTGVAQGRISELERLVFRVRYHYEEAVLIASVLDLEPEQVIPEKMVGWKGQTKFSTITEVPLERLLEYKDRAESHYLLNSPDEAIEKKDDLARVKMLVGRLSDRKKLIINLRYGLDKELGGPYTLAEIGECLGLSGARVSWEEQKAITILQKIAGSDWLMRDINAMSLDKIEDDVSLEEIACGDLLMKEISAKSLEKDKVKK